MKYWLFAFLLIALGLAGVSAAWLFFDFSIWIIAPSVVLILVGLMPLSAAKEHLRQRYWARQQKDTGQSGQDPGGAA